MTTRTNRPTDGREFIRVSVDIARHPKILALGDPAAAWGYAAAMAYAGAYFTDGWITIQTIAREGNISTQRARKLVAVGLVHEHGHACPKCPEIPKGQAYIHDYLDHNRSRAEADEQRRSKAEAGKRGAEKRWAGTRRSSAKTTPVSDGTCHSASQDTSNSTNMAEGEEEKNSTRLPKASHVSTTRELDDRPAGPAPSGPRSTAAYRLVDRTIGKNIPSATRTALAFETVALLGEFPEPTLAEALTRWNSKTGIGPKILPSLVADVIKEDTGAGTTLAAGGRATGVVGPSGRGAKVAGWLDLGDAAAAMAEPAPLLDSPYLLLEGGTL